MNDPHDIIAGVAWTFAVELERALHEALDAALPEGWAMGDLRGRLERKQHASGQEEFLLDDEVILVLSPPSLRVREGEQEKFTYQRQVWRRGKKTKE